MWEIFTCGRVPYSEVPATSLLRTLQRGQRLARPDNYACSDNMYVATTSTSMHIHDMC